MVGRRTVRVVGVLAAVLLVGAGCGGDAEPSAGKTTTPPLTTVVPSADPSPGQPPKPIPSPGQPPRVTPPPGNPPPVKPPPGMGTAIIKTRTLSQVPVPNVPVYVTLVQPCDPASHDIPLGETREVLNRQAVTDGSGSATFAVPLGCYRFGMGAPPPGTKPVPEGMHQLFLVREAEVVEGLLRFDDTGQPQCSPGAIAHDLDDIGGLTEYQAKVHYCDGAWGVIVWDAPGDSQRIVRRGNGGWVTYLVFPHDQCWSKAAADGVPESLRHYFSC
ncbi:hypothetical protein ACIBCD_02090 [Nocardia brasiliensis]|uniref:hypothetical protein n=1 Tax=Nocardia brasiliensis TaxID=37326 RepID=UPI002458EBA2|nr:hypothetical protein [Nocardia brasiliensis]